MAMTLETLRKLVALDPADPLSRFALGKKLLESLFIDDPEAKGKLAEAEGHLRYSLSRDSAHLASYFNLARVLVQLGKYSDAGAVLVPGVEQADAVGEGMGRDLAPAMRQMLADLPDVRLATPGEVVDLRHAVLRAGMPREAGVFPGDDLASTLHAVATVGGRVVCCGTMMVQEHDGRSSWRLRGMATDPAFQSKGLGRLVLALLERESQRMLPTGHLWCNARIGAVNFYESQGWRVITAQTYDIPTAGLHHTMVKDLA